MADLAVIILTFDEERHIERAIKAIAPAAAEIYVIDSFSNDRTPQIARANGATVLQNKFINHAKQFQWALEHAPIKCEWVMRLDADEIVEPDLVAEINQKLPALPLDVTGVNLKRKHIFMGRWIKHGGRYPLILLRIWRRGSADIEDRWMDEHMILRTGTAVMFNGGFSDHNLRDLTFFIDKHNKYATREAIDVILARRNLLATNALLGRSNTSLQTSMKRRVKVGIYNKLPFAVSSLLYFSFRYFLQLGFLDRIEGLIYHVLQGFWYRFLVGAKVKEYERAVRGISDDDELVRTLSKLTEYELQIRKP